MEPSPTQSEQRRGNGFTAAFRRARALAHRTRMGRTVWRVAIAVAGAIVVVGGIVLLPLPGPGWLIIFAGIGIWATEFAWATRLLRWTRRQVQRLLGWWSNLPRYSKTLIVALCLAVVAGAILGYLRVRDDIPLI